MKQLMFDVISHDSIVLDNLLSRLLVLDHLQVSVYESLALFVLNCAIMVKFCELKCIGSVVYGKRNAKKNTDH